MATELLCVAHAQHPYYGVRRLSLELGWSENKTRRVRRLAGIRIVTPRKKHSRGKPVPAEIVAPSNALKHYAVFKNQARPQDGMNYAAMVNSGGWVQDFTHLWFDRTWHYLAAIIDLKTRQVVGWSYGLNHSSELTYKALLDALSKHSPPAILHSDQGSEYLSYKHHLLCERMEMTLSCSNKSSPWQNGFMESFFGKFKTELGSLSQFKGIPELYEAIALAMHYYNTKRIHTSLHMSPAAYAASLTTRDNLLQKKGA